MRHRARARKFGRNSSHRLAMVRNLVTSLLDHERVETTDAKAKELRRVADRMITLGKRGDLHARRRALRVIRQREVAAKVFGELADRYRERAGGYTRVVKTRTRVGDAAPLAIVELVEPLEGAKPAKQAGEAPSGRRKARRKAAAEAAPKKKTRTAKPAARPAAKPAKKAAAKKPAVKKPPAKKSAGRKTSPKKSG